MIHFRGRFAAVKTFAFQIQRIQQETLGGRRPIPDKPPPPYTPPTSPVRLTKQPAAAAAKPVVAHYVPSSRNEVLELVSPLAKAMFRAKASGDPFDRESARRALLENSDHASKKTFATLVVDLALEMFADVYRCESELQNPPWMPQKSITKARMNLPRSETDLVARMQREALIFFGFERRSQKENLIVRWAQKRRDRVDQILVRELHAEEEAWTNYSEDEALVKDQLTATMMDLLIDDTVRHMTAVFENSS